MQDSAPSEDSGIISLLTKDIQVAADGTSTQTIHVEVHANNDAGALQLGKASFSYDTTMQEIEVSEAHTLKASGQNIPVQASAIYEQLPPNLQGDVTSYRSKVIVFPQFAAGDTAVYTIKLVTKQPFFSGQFTAAEAFPRTMAYGEMRETITAPKSLPLNVESHDVEFSKKESGNDIVYSWHYSAPKATSDPFPPCRRWTACRVFSFPASAITRNWGKLMPQRPKAGGP